MKPVLFQSRKRNREKQTKLREICLQITEKFNERWKKMHIHKTMSWCLYFKFFKFSRFPQLYKLSQMYIYGFLSQTCYDIYLKFVTSIEFCHISVTLWRDPSAAVGGDLVHSCWLWVCSRNKMIKMKNNWYKIGEEMNYICTLNIDCKED